MSSATVSHPLSQAPGLVVGIEKGAIDRATDILDRAMTVAERRSGITAA